MANSIPSRPGANQLGADPRALMLDLFGGEVLSAFETATIMRDKHQVKQLSKGRSFKFPAIWKAGGGYHTPGVEITGRQIAHTEITVEPDDKLVSDVFVSDIDELLNHYDVRAPYTKELGVFLARRFDANVIRSIILSARSGALFTGDTGGTGLQSASFASDGQALLDGISQAKQAMDEKDVPVNAMPVHALFKPAQWYLMARTERNLNKDYGGQGSLTNQTLSTVDEIMVHKSNIASDVFGADNTIAPFSTVGDENFLPTPYRAKFGTTAGIVWTPMAACSAMVQDVSFQIEDQVRKQGTLLLARLMVGTRKLRSKCAVELRTGAVPA